MHISNENLGESDSSVFRNFDRRMSVDQGLSWRLPYLNLGENPNYLTKNYFNELRWGKNVSIEYNSFFSKTKGWGLRASYFNTTNQLDGLFDATETGDTVTGTVSQDVSLIFLGIVFLTKKAALGEKAVFVGSVDFGVLFYHELEQDFDVVHILTDGRGAPFSTLSE